MVWKSWSTFVFLTQLSCSPTPMHLSSYSRHSDTCWDKQKCHHLPNYQERARKVLKVPNPWNHHNMFIFQPLGGEGGGRERERINLTFLHTRAISTLSSFYCWFPQGGTPALFPKILKKLWLILLHSELLKTEVQWTTVGISLGGGGGLLFLICFIGHHQLLVVHISLFSVCHFPLLNKSQIRLLFSVHLLIWPPQSSSGLGRRCNWENPGWGKPLGQFGFRWKINRMALIRFQRSAWLVWNNTKTRRISGFLNQVS